MKDRIPIEGRDGAFGAYIARPKTFPAPAVVVLHEVFGVNADIRKTCDELAEQDFLAVAPDLFWRQEPGVDLHGSRFPAIAALGEEAKDDYLLTNPTIRNAKAIVRSTTRQR